MSQGTIPNLDSFTGSLITNNYFIVHDGVDAKKVTFGEMSNKVFSGSTSIESDGTQHNLTGSIIPTQNAQYDLGSAEYKIRHLYLSSNSLYLGETNLSEQDVMNTTKINDTIVPVSYDSPGRKGEIRYDNTHVYICVEDNLWRRIIADSIW